MSRRVVITGLGVVTGCGLGADALWEALIAGRSALGPITRMEVGGFRSRLGAEVQNFSAKDHVPKSYRKAVKVMARDTELAVGAAKLAVEDARLVTRGTLAEGSTEPTTYPQARMGCHIGAGLIAAETDELTMALATARSEGGEFSLKSWGDEQGEGGGGMLNLQPLWMLKYLPNMLACHVTIIHGPEGPSNTITCAEASALLSIGESARVIQRDDADVCFSGGAESKLNPMGLLRMDLAGRLAATGESGEASSFVKPFDPGATGGLLGEGGGIVILEEAESARSRGAKVYAEVAGFGAAQSAPPAPTIPPFDAGAVSAAERDDGLALAVWAALKDAGVSPDEIDLIVPHGSGIAAVDAAEAASLRMVFGARLKEIPLVTLVPIVGETMAAAGAVQAAVGALCLKHQRVPARVHAGAPAAGLDAGAAPSRGAKLRSALVCTGSLGGQNAAVVLKAVSERV